MTLTPEIIAHLQQRYPTDLLTYQGVTYPITIYPARPDSALDDLLGTFNQDLTSHHAIYDESHLQQIRSTRPVTNGLCYIFDSFQTDPPRINARLGHYFDMLATCDAIDHELRANPTSTPLRDALHQSISPQEALYNGMGRSGTIGGAVLTVFNDGTTYRALIVQRSNQVATGAGKLHVMPAFIVQPSHDVMGEWSFRYHIIREYAEELFAMPEYEHWQTPVDSMHYFQHHPHVIELEAMLADGRAGLYATGVVMNLMSLRYELCSLLVIHDPDWHKRNESDLQVALHTERQATFYPAIDRLDTLPPNWHTYIEPQGMGALYLGLAFLKNILK
jgi:hypothetical protein